MDKGRGKDRGGKQVKKGMEREEGEQRREERGKGRKKV